ncbi:hypothetical protein ACJRW5_07800 [Pseudomonas sp. SH1-B]
MQPDNPYSAPQAELLDSAGPPSLPGWSVRQLRLLGWLALVSVLVNTLLVALTFAAAWLEPHEADRLQTFTGWLSLVLTLLGCYLLLRFKTFVEARFAARRLGAPIWSVLVVTLLLELADSFFGEQLFGALDWPTIGYVLLLVMLGSCTTWLGVRLLKLPLPYPALKVMAWLNIVGGVLLASVILMLVALLPLLGAGVALVLVFFRGAAELQGASR